MKKNIFVVLLCYCVVGCVTHPLGIADETWNKMTPEQQANAYKQQSQIDAKAKATKLAAEQQEKKEIAKIKANPKYGQYIQCTVDDAKYHDFIDGVNVVQPFSFDAITDKTENVKVSYYRNGNKFFDEHKNLYVFFDGQQIKLCESNNSLNDKCSLLNATSTQYQKGIKLKFSGDILSGYARCDMVYHGRRHHSNRHGNNIVINI